MNSCSRCSHVLSPDVHIIEFRQNSPGMLCLFFCLVIFVRSCKQSLTVSTSCSFLDWKPGMAHFTHSLTWVGVTGTSVNCDKNNPASCNLKITKTIQFNTDDRFFTIQVTLQNTGSTTLYDLYYSRNVRFFLLFFCYNVSPTLNFSLTFLSSVVFSFSSTFFFFPPS